MKVCGWTIKRGDVRINAEWIATIPSDERYPDEHPIECWIRDRAVHVAEDRQYYPGGSYEIPLAVIEALQARQAP